MACVGRSGYGSRCMRADFIRQVGLDTTAWGIGQLGN